MSKDYNKPGIAPIGFDFDASELARTQAYMTLSRKDVLGIVHSAVEELGIEDERIVEMKRAVLDEVVEGRLAHALRTAIVGAGRAGCTCIK